MPDFGICREIVLGFHAAAITAGWNVWIFTDIQSYMLDALHRPEVKGVLIGPFTANAVLDSGLRRQAVIAAETDLTGLSIPSVRVENAAIGIAAADHLLDQGQRDFSAFGWPEGFFLERTKAFEQRTLKAGARFHRRWNEAGRVWVPGENEEFENSIRTWIKSLPRPVAVLAGTDVWGRMLNVLLYIWGVRVPEDVAIIGVDNDSLVCETSIPPLSSVAVPWRKVGAEAARLMAQAFAAPKHRLQPAPLVVVPPSGVVARRSSDMLAVKDLNVAAALRIIRDHATEPLSVTDILRRVPIGRHALQRAFRKHVGRTMLDEIHRVRVERAKSLLATTDLSMPDVAVRSGFSSAPNLSVMFRRETGTTPGSYRRAFRTLVSA